MHLRPNHLRPNGRVSMTHKTFEAVVFDFDYTLGDSSEGVIDCVNFAFRELGLPIGSSERIRRTIGLSLAKTFVALVEKEDKTQSEEFARLFIERADQVMVEKTVLFDSVRPTLEVLKRRGLSLGIVSTKYRYRIEAITQRENLDKMFNIIIGGEDVSDHKPHPKGLLTAIERLKCQPQNTLYVGDSVTDAQTAERAKVPFVSVLSGVTSRADFDDYNVFAILNNLSELPRLILN